MKEESFKKSLIFTQTCLYEPCFRAMIKAKVKINHIHFRLLGSYLFWVSSKIGFGISPRDNLNEMSKPILWIKVLMKAI